MMRFSGDAEYPTWGLFTIFECTEQATARNKIDLMI